MKKLRLSAATALKVALGCFIGLGIFMYQRYEQSVAGVGLTTAAEDLEGAASSLRSLLAEAETGARGYALTGEPGFLEACTDAISGITFQMDRLRGIVGPSEDQQRRLAELERAVQVKTGRVKQLIELRRTMQHDEAVALVAADAVREPPDRIAFLIRAMVDDSWATLSAELAAHRLTVRTTRGLMVSLFGLATGLLLFAVVRVRRELRRRLDAEYALRTAYAQVEERVRLRTAELTATNSLLRESEDRFRQLAEQKDQALIERSEALAREQAARGDAELANRFRDRFLATVSHELRTPLNAIVGWTHLLRAGMMDNRERALEAIDRNAALQARLIDDLLDVSRMEQGRFSMAPVVVDFRAVVQAAVAAVGPAAEAKSIAIAGLVSEAHPISVLGDQRRLQQAVVNLLANAVKFSRPGGTVQVSVGEAGCAAHLTVLDAGEGIDTSFLPHVFQAFRQDTTRPARAGLGLGLAIARGIIERHQGTITVESAGRDRGTRFHVTLPLGTEDDLAAPGEASPTGSATRTRLYGGRRRRRARLQQSH